MKLRYYNQEDYDVFKNFWIQHEHKIINKDMLSPVGLVVEIDNKIIGGTWLYIMNGCNVAQIAWTTLNPEAKIKEKYACLELLNTGIVETCKKMKKENIVVFTTKGLKRYFHKKGYNMYTDHTLLIGEL